MKLTTGSDPVFIICIFQHIQVTDVPGLTDKMIFHRFSHRTFRFSLVQAIMKFTILTFPEDLREIMKQIRGKSSASGSGRGGVEKPGRFVEHLGFFHGTLFGVP